MTLLEGFMLSTLPRVIATLIWLWLITRHIWPQRREYGRLHILSWWSVILLLISTNHQFCEISSYLYSHHHHFTLALSEMSIWEQAPPTAVIVLWKTVLRKTIRHSMRRSVWQTLIPHDHTTSTTLLSGVLIQHWYNGLHKTVYYRLLMIILVLPSFAIYSCQDRLLQRIGLSTALLYTQSTKPQTRIQFIPLLC